MKYLAIDIETTGLNVKKCGIIEIGAVYDDGESDTDMLNEFHVCIDPGDVVWELPALRMHADWYPKLENLVAPARTIEEFQAWLERVHRRSETLNVAGKNPKFDLSFLSPRGYFNGFKLRHRLIDPAILFARWDDEALPNLEECKRRASLEDTVTHRALDDAYDIVRLLRAGIVD